MPFIGKAALQGNSKIDQYVTTVGSGGQTNFSVLIEGGDEYAVYLNGVLLQDTVDYTASGTQVALSSAAVENDIVEVHVFRSFFLVDAIRKTGGDTITGDIAIADDKKLSFGTTSDVSLEYDEDGTDTLLISGGDVTVADDKKLYFGTGKDAHIEYDEDGTDNYITACGWGYVCGWNRGHRHRLSRRKQRIKTWRHFNNTNRNQHKQTSNHGKINCHGNSIRMRKIWPHPM